MKLTKKEFEKKFGKVCKKCGFRDKYVMTSKSAEGGMNSVCKCK